MDIMARFNPEYRLKSHQLELEAGKIQLHSQIEQAKLQQKQRHHQEMLEFQRQKIAIEQQQAEAQNQAIIEKEIIAGKNALALSINNFICTHLENNSQLLNDHYRSHLDRRREWENNITGIRKSLFEIEADTIRQKALLKQEHQQTIERMRLEAELKQNEQKNLLNLNIIEEKFRKKQEIEKMVLEYNLKFLELELNHYLQNERITYDSLNNIIMRIIERIVGLNEQVNSEDVERFVNEAMRQAYG